VRMFDALTQVLHAAVLGALLAFAWAMPAAAHPGHGVTSKPPVQGTMTSTDGVRQFPAVASFSVDEAIVCGMTRISMSSPSNTSQPSGALGRICCGTMCTVAVIEPIATSLPTRIPHRFRLLLLPETLALAHMPSLPARPPRTSDIA